MTRQATVLSKLSHFNTLKAAAIYCQIHHYQQNSFFFHIRTSTTLVLAPLGDAVLEHDLNNVRPLFVLSLFVTPLQCKLFLFTFP